MTALAALGCRSHVPDTGTDTVTTPTAEPPAFTALGPADPLHVTFMAPLVDGPDAEGWLETRPIPSAAAFTEVLPSWNAPAESAFLVEVRVASGPPSGASGPSDAAWSPWLRIGDWNVSSRDEAARTAFDGGQVNVDVLALEQPYDHVQLRVASVADPAGDPRGAPEGAPERAQSGPTAASPLDPGSIRLHVTLSDLHALPARLAVEASAPWPLPVALEVPARSQRTVGDDIAHRICSPTSVSMVAAFHGATVAPRSMAEAVLDPHFDIYGNWNRAVQGAFSFGVPGRLVRVSSWETVHAFLASGQPLVASIKAQEGELEGAPYESTAGHLLVVTGLGPNGAVHVNDPAASGPGGVARVYRRRDMERVWFANGGVAYAFEPVRAERSAGVGG